MGEPQGLDEFLTDQDPQSAIAAQGMQKIGSAVGNEAQAQYQQGGERIHEALRGDVSTPSGRAPLESLGQQAAMSSVELPHLEGYGPVQPNGIIDKAMQRFPGTTSLKELSDAVANSSLSEAHPISKGVQQAVQQRRSYAEGGTVDEPAGLDSYLGSPSPTQGTSEPAGLDDYIQPEMQEAKYGTPSQVALTAAEGLGKGLFGPLATGAERLAGVAPEDILGREQANPVAHYGAEIAGLVAPALATGGASAFTQAGLLEAGGKALGLAGGETLAARIGTGAAKAAVDNMLIQGSDETSKMILNDPQQSAQTAIANIGLAGLIGSALGATGAGASALWQSAVGGKAGQVIEDFKGRMNEHIANPDPVSAMQTELQDHYTNMKSYADEVYGPTGLKAQDVEKALPAMSPKISDQVQDLAGKMDKTIKTMVGDQYTYPPRLTQMLQSDYDNFVNRVSAPDAGAKEIFNATQDLKQTLQGYAKFEKRIAPFAEEAGFVKQSKDLQYDFRQALEDTGVWGDAAKRQASINSAFKQYLPALQDFEKKFTTEVAGEKQVDPAKVNTYINQLGKSNAEIKQTMLKNYIAASDKYKQVINQTHANLNLDSPIVNSPMNTTMSSLDKKTLGARLADAFISKGLSDGSGKILGGAIGGSLAHVAGLHGEIGAIIGSQALGPFFNSVLPAIAKSVMNKSSSAVGLRAATDFGISAAQGDSALTKGAKNIFKAGSQVLPESLLPSEKDKAKLNKLSLEAQTNPDKMLASDDKLQHYMPDHSQAMNQTMGQAITYLNSLRADTSRQSPLDSKPVVSTSQKASFDNALAIAQQPLIVLDKIKQGTLTATDISHVAAMYPSLYNGIKDKLTAAMTDHLAKGDSVPYRTRIGLSMFLAQPMDSTMQPASIIAAQLTPPVQTQQVPQGKRSKGSPSSPALQKMANMYNTPSQARQREVQTK